MNKEKTVSIRQDDIFLNIAISNCTWALGL